MKKIYIVLIFIFLYINIVCLHHTLLKEDTRVEIDENVEGTTEYKTKTIT